jgi:DNA-binding transcriptional ArsR family regulator
MDTRKIALRLEALGNETRLEVYRLLVRAGDEGLAVGAIQTKTKVARSTLSHHIHKLITVGLVKQERRGTTLICRAQFEAMNQTLGFLQEECCADVRKPRSGAA